MSFTNICTVNHLCQFPLNNALPLKKKILRCTLMPNIVNCENLDQ